MYIWLQVSHGITMATQIELWATGLKRVRQLQWQFFFFFFDAPIEADSLPRLKSSKLKSVNSTTMFKPCVASRKAEPQCTTHYHRLNLTLKPRLSGLLSMRALQRLLPPHPEAKTKQFTACPNTQDLTRMQRGAGPPTVQIKRIQVRRGR